MEWQINTPAKINLFFEVERRREDGFHEISSLISPVSLYDTLTFRLREEDGDVHLEIENPIPPECPCAGFPPAAEMNHEVQTGSRETQTSPQFPAQIPTDERNLIVRAARLLQSVESAKSKKLPGVSIITQKRIPSEAGLGGGSSDAAATLLVLNRLWELGLSRTELQGLGVQLGCDVPLFLSRFPVIAQGRGELLAEVPSGETLPELHFVLVKPAQGLSTPAVYRSCTPRNAAPESACTDVSTEALLHAWRGGDLEAIAANLFNRLEMPAFRLLPELQDLRQAVARMEDPCVGFAMTGSGSACFGLCRDREHALHAADELRSWGTTFAVTSVLRSLQMS